MVLKILLLISIALQLLAAVTAMRLTRVTKYNLSWILITVALTAMALQRLVEFMDVAYDKEFTIAPEVEVWIGVATSLCFAAGVFLVRKILAHIADAEEKRRSYEKQILDANIRAEEKERRRIAGEIHEGLGPLMSSVKMSVSALAKMNSDPRQAMIIENTNMVIDEAVKSLREISNNLNSHVLTNFGVARALAGFINKLSAVSDIAITFDTDMRDVRFASDKEIVLYRVALELINNTLKHSGATRMKIALRRRGNEILFTFEDDGCGFDPRRHTTGDPSGMGIPNIVSRVHSVKGGIDIDSAPGKGVKVRLRMIND